MLAITSGDLRAGDKLPSVRELALRHRIHQNTASAAYRWLGENGWVESRKGSGVYVRAVAQTKIDETNETIQSELDRAILTFLENTKERGFDRRQIKSRLDALLNSEPPQRIVIVEAGADLSRILADEIAEEFSLPITVAATASNGDVRENSLIVSLAELPSEFAHASPVFVRLKFNSVQDAMRGRTKPSKTDLIGVASHWEMFRRWSQTMLVAVGIAEENLVVRDAGEDGWQSGLNSCCVVIADSLTAKRLANLKNVAVFRLISADSIREMRRLLS